MSVEAERINRSIPPENLPFHDLEQIIEMAQKALDHGDAEVDKDQLNELRRIARDKRGH